MLAFFHHLLFIVYLLLLLFWRYLQKCFICFKDRLFCFNLLWSEKIIWGGLLFVFWAFIFWLFYSWPVYQSCYLLSKCWPFLHDFELSCTAVPNFSLWKGSETHILYLVCQSLNFTDSLTKINYCNCFTYFNDKNKN